jgi:uncharacterized protein
MGKTALVTGASAGLGTEFAKLLGADGHDVVLVARRRDKLEELASQLEKRHAIKCHVVAADLAERGAPERIAGEVTRRNLAIEILVNNAGFGTTGTFAESDVARELALVEVNVTALVHLTHLFLPAMIARKSGRILNVGSTAGFVPGPFMAGYYASKAFVNSFTEALAFELRGTGVTATVSCPGATATEFAQVAGNASSRLFKMGQMGAVEVAKHAYVAMKRGQVMAIPGLKNKLSVQSLRVSPRAVARSIAGGLNRTKDAPRLPARSS